MNILRLFKKGEEPPKKDWYGYCNRCGKGYISEESVLDARVDTLKPTGVSVHCRVCGHPSSVLMVPHFKNTQNPRAAGANSAANAKT